MGGRKWVYDWAQCEEPYKNELDRLAWLWIKGDLSHQLLALELWNMWDRSQPDGLPTTIAKTGGSDVRLQIEIFAGVMCEALKGMDESPQHRRRILEIADWKFNGPRGPQR